MRSTNNILPQIDRNKGFSKTKSQDEFNFKTRFSFNEIPLNNGFNNKNNPLKKSLNLKQDTSLSLSQNKNFMKEFANKLEKHSYDIEERDELIKELELTLEKLRIEFINEKSISDEKTRQIKDINDNYDKLNNRFKTNHIKMEELVTKVQFYEKEIKKMKEDDFDSEQYKIKEQNQLKRIQELEQTIQNNNILQQSNENNKNIELQSIQSKYNETLNLNKTLTTDLEKKNKELQEALIKIKAFEEEKKAVENSIQNLRRSSTLKQQELESKFIEQENQMKNLNALKDENIKLNNQIKELKQQLNENSSSKNQQINQINELQEINNKQKEQINSFITEEGTMSQQLQDIKNQNIQLEQQISQKNDKLQNMLKELENVRTKQSTNDKSSTELKQNLNELKKKYDDQEKSLSNATSQLSNIQKQSKKLDEAEKEILKSLKCNFCDQFIKEPITIIPCGHSFCFGCKKAYAKDCIKCGPKVKVEAMYRNELLDDIIGMVKIVQTLQSALKLI